MSHPSDDTLRLLAACRLNEGQEDEIERHLDECVNCRQRLIDFERQDQSPIIQEMRAAGQDAPPDSDDLGIPAPPGDAGGGFSPGDCIGGNYRLETPLGRGGMGVAWKAFDETAQRYVVLKFVPKEIQNIAEAMNAVRESFRRVHALQHQHICPLYGLFDDPQAGLFLVMKFVDGLTLGEYRRQYAEKHGSMSFEEIVQILRAMAEALDYAHERKVIHRDIKPQNIMIGVMDGVQIIDFGLADEIRSSMERFSGAVVTKISGTRPYMAPEQWQGKPQDARTDQYALAATAYELLAGRVPFSGADTGILKNAVLHDQPTPIPDLPEHVNAALLKGLAKDRKDRFENCTAFVDALASKTPRRKRVRNVLLSAFIVAAISMALFFVLWQSHSPEPLLPSQPASSTTGDTREQGLSFVYERLVALGWNVEKATQRTSEYDFELYKKETDKRIRVKVKTVRGDNNFAFGSNIDRMKGDFWILVKMPTNPEQEPTTFIMRPTEVENLIHIYGGNKSDSKPSYWLRPEAYEKDKYRNRWELLESPNR